MTISLYFWLAVFFCAVAVLLMRVHPVRIARRGKRFALLYCAVLLADVFLMAMFTLVFLTHPVDGL